MTAEALTAALNQAIQHGTSRLPNAQERAGATLPPGAVIFAQWGSYNAYDCPELAQYLTANPTHAPLKP